jgi:hypothetical protein
LFGRKLLVFRSLVGKLADGRASLGRPRNVVANVAALSNCVRPEVSIDSPGPPVGSMEKDGSGMFSHVSDPSFGFAVLVMGTDCTVCDGLSGFLDVFSEKVVCKASVVCVVVLDGHSMGLAVLFECYFGFYGFV